jgi:hypothetical protein
VPAARGGERGGIERTTANVFFFFERDDSGDDQVMRENPASRGTEASGDQ